MAGGGGSEGGGGGSWVGDDAGGNGCRGGSGGGDSRRHRWPSLAQAPAILHLDHALLPAMNSSPALLAPLHYPFSET